MHSPMRGTYGEDEQQGQAMKASVRSGDKASQWEANRVSVDRVEERSLRMSPNMVVGGEYYLLDDLPHTRLKSNLNP